MTKRFLITAGIMGALSVLLGVLGVQFLKGNIPNEQLSMYNTANQFIMYHALALLGLSVMNRYISRSYVNTIYYLFVIGIGLFSGSLLLISLKEVTGIGFESLSNLTPAGGLLLIIGWIVLIFGGSSYEHKKKHG